MAGRKSPEDLHVCVFVNYRLTLHKVYQMSPKQRSYRNLNNNRVNDIDGNVEMLSAADKHELVVIS